MQQEGIQYDFQAGGNALASLERLEKGLGAVNKRLGEFESAASSLKGTTDVLKRNLSQTAKESKVIGQSFAQGTKFSKELAAAEKLRIAQAKVGLQAERVAIAKAREERAQAALEFKKQVAEERRLYLQQQQLLRKLRQEEARRNKERNRKNAEFRKGASSIGQGLGFGGLGSQFGAVVTATGPFGAAMAAAGIALGGLRTAARLATEAIRLQGEALLKSAKDAAEFEQEITRVNALVGGTTSTFNKLREAALAGGRTTLFSVQEAGQGLRFLAQAGFDAQKATAALPDVLNLATAGTIDLAKASDIATNILTGYGKSTSELAGVNDVLTTTFTNSNTNLIELGGAFSFVGGIANATGQDIEGVSALLGVLANNGVKATRGGRAVANAIQRLAKQTPEASATLEKLGVDVLGSDGKLRQFNDVLRDLNTAGASASDILTIFGTVAGRSLIGPIQGGIAELDRLEAKTRSAAGATDRLAKTVQDTALSQFKIFQSAVSVLSVELGTRFLSTAKEAFKALTEGVNSLSGNTALLDGFKAVAQDLTLILANLLDVAAVVSEPFFLIGGAAIELGKALDINNSRIIELIKRFITLNPIIGPTVQAVTLLYRGFRTLVRVIDVVASSRAFKAVESFVSSIAAGFDRLTQRIKDTVSELPGIKQIVGAVESITSAFEETEEPVDGFLSSLRQSSRLGKETSSALSQTANRLRGVASGADDAKTSIENLSNATRTGIGVVRGYATAVAGLQTSTVRFVRFAGGLSKIVRSAFPDQPVTQLDARLQAVIGTLGVLGKAAQDTFKSGNINTFEQSLKNQQESAQKQLEINSLNSQLFGAEIVALKDTNELNRKRASINAQIAKVKIGILKGTINQEKGEARIIALRRQLNDELKQSAASRAKESEEQRKQLDALLKAVGGVAGRVSSAFEGVRLDGGFAGVLRSIETSQLNITRLQLESNDARRDGNIQRSIALRAQADLLSLESQGLDPLTKQDRIRAINLRKQRDLNAAKIRELQIEADLLAAQGKTQQAARVREQVEKLTLENRQDLSRQDKERIRQTQELNRIAKDREQRQQRLIARAEAQLETQRLLAKTDQQRNVIVSEYELTLQRINASNADEALKQEQRLQAQIKQRQQLAQLAIQQSQAISSAVRSGIDTDVSSILDQNATSRQLELQNRLEQLQRSREVAQEGGADTTLLERQIELQQRRIEKEREFQQELQSTFELYQRGATQIVDIGENLSAFLVLQNASTTAWRDNAEAQQAAVSGLSALVGLGSVIAQAQVEDAKTRAKVEGSINAAASVANLGLYAASSFTAGQYLTASINHGIAAAKYFAVAGSSGSVGGRSGGGSGGVQGSATAFVPNIEEERARTAEAIGQAVANGFGQAQQVVYNIDMSNSTNLEDAPTTGRRILRAVELAETDTIQAGIG